MKNYTKSIIALIFMLVNAVLYAQDFQGVATYKTSMKMDFKIDSAAQSQGINKDMQAKLNEMLQKQFQKEYKLTFTPYESLYKQEEKLAAPSPQNGGFQVMVVGDGQSSTLYKNTKEKRYAQQQEILGKKFLVQDVLEDTEWKLEKDTKFIGQYTCYKATRTIEMERMTSMSFGSDSEEEPEVTKEKVTVTAWYTPEIPVNAGPELYWGLPGLILEVNDGSQTMVCSKIVLNPKKKVSIKEPTNGKKVNAKKFEEIMRKKTKEMTERYRGNGRGDGNEIRIEIGG
ncbi:GLPGLI family protein [uncultured Kordia sp.]|uniref:GLPGLI family protein n=1 Tax=uncultured Kordia sp. TaxID=507699 RepID=UPI0026070445|nr:GLPGLI family protein [uncultured Kordia sp.]